MEASGWLVDGAPDQDNMFAAGCGGYETFWGYLYGYAIGKVSAIFKGSGNAVIDFGSCFSNGVTKVYLNGNEIGSASANQQSVVANFTYKAGDNLTVTEEQVGIMKINSLHLEGCERKGNDDYKVKHRTFQDNCYPNKKF